MTTSPLILLPGYFLHAFKVRSFSVVNYLRYFVGTEQIAKIIYLVMYSLYFCGFFMVTLLITFSISVGFYSNFAHN
jgi:hypothetical protein